jgi:hydrogenase expression/formation protein HypE
MKHDHVTLGHGSGGRLTQELIRGIFARTFSNPHLEPLDDSAVLPAPEGKLAFTTDGFVVSPLFFPGGDVGRLAVVGTVNDLAVAGAVPLYLSAAAIIEEGFPIRDLERVAGSMADAAKEAGVTIVTGDTKVVEKGHGDGLYIVTTGVGRVEREPAPAPAEGDVVIVSGPIGDHGAAIAGHRASIETGELCSDCGSISGLVQALFGAGIAPRFMRDPTRGGLATALAEMAKKEEVTVEVREEALPVRKEVRAVCEILGLDPLYLPCEGRLVCVVMSDQADEAVEVLKKCKEGAGACRIGRLMKAQEGPVVLVSRYGGSKIYDTLTSDPLPRIC